MSSFKPSSIPTDLRTFLGLLTAGSLLFYALILRAGGMANGELLVLGLMWVPGLSAILTVLIHRRGLGSLGWRPGRAVYLLIAYFLPVLYALPPYGLVWLSGLGALDLSQLSSPIDLLLLASLGVLLSLVSALGEEIGWRGYFIARLAQLMPYRRAVLLSAAVWILWHTPLILFSDYRAAGTPIWYSWLCFAVMVTGITFAFSWLRLRSGSLWPAALLHASHNLFIQGIFDVVTGNTGITAYLTGEFGLGLALVAIPIGLFFARRDFSPVFPQKTT